MKEWAIPAPWGDISLMSWGNPTASPVLLVHCKEDDLAILIPFLKLLQADHYYVAVNMPGNGKSHPFPKGRPMVGEHLIEVIEIVVKHLQWKRFTFIGLSKDCDLGLLYNYMYPGRIHRIIFLNPRRSLRRFQLQNMQDFYNKYIRKNDNTDPAVAVAKKARGLRAGEAEIILSMDFMKSGKNQYKFSWEDPENQSPGNFTVDLYKEIPLKYTPLGILLDARKNRKAYEDAKALEQPPNVPIPLLNYSVKCNDAVHVSQEEEDFVKALAGFFKKNVVPKSLL